MFNRFLLIVVFVPLAIVLIALAVANRASVPFTLDPFNPGNPALTLQMPLFVLLFAAIVVGLLIGSMATWFKQGRYRKAARQRGLEAQYAEQQAAAKTSHGQSLVKTAS
ncbi:LapA family protein [Mesorhizobium sp. SB112]|uniref:LapA family protein n=1 Tax=Mesorhizobium sp. SB112 TaxID=3151853 RepID=UPI0032658DE0